MKIVASEHFSNDDFCNAVPWTGSGADHCYHDDVTATGYSHGYCTGDADMTISGPCGSWLDEELRIRYW